MTQAFFDFEDGSWTEVIEEDDAATYERELHEWMEAQKSDDLKAVEKERDEWKDRYEALRADVEGKREDNWAIESDRCFYAAVVLKGILNRDDEREPRGQSWAP